MPSLDAFLTNPHVLTIIGPLVSAIIGGLIVAFVNALLARRKMQSEIEIQQLLSAYGLLLHAIGHLSRRSILYTHLCHLTLPELLEVENTSSLPYPAPIHPIQ